MYTQVCLLNKQLLKSYAIITNGDPIVKQQMEIEAYAVHLEAQGVRKVPMTDRWMVCIAQEAMLLHYSSATIFRFESGSLLDMCTESIVWQGQT